MTPNLAVIHIHPAHLRGFKLWVPLFLLWIPVLVLSPLILVGLVVAGAVCFGVGINFFRALRVFRDILCSLPGIDVRVTAEGNKVLVRIL
jgi:hypothetical protein